jgi:hypothetical protein
MFGYQRGVVAIQSGYSNGRSIHDLLLKGKIVISGEDHKGRAFERTAIVRNGEIWENKLKQNKKLIYHIAYGQFEKIPGNGREIVRFKEGTGKGRHGKSRRNEILFSHKGVCHSWYKNGRLVRQKFIYDNKKTAYDYSGFKTACIVKGYDGRLLYEIKGALDGRNNIYNGSHSVLSREMRHWFLEREPFEVKKSGKIIYKGQIQNRQRIGEWVENGKRVFYVNGVAIPKRLYETPPEKLDPAKIIKLPNAQLRMAMMEKIGPDRIADIGRVVHKDKAMRLYDIKNYDVRILRVQCPTTKAYYFLKVPKDSSKCEEARQWTFGVGNGFNKQIKFAKET